MITHGGSSDIWYYRKRKEMDILEEYFYSLPKEYQEAMIRGEFTKIDRKKQIDNFRKRIALKQYDFEEKVKEKVLSLLKKNK